MYKFSPNLYTLLAEKFFDSISSLTFYAGVIEFEYDNTALRFVATIIPYYIKERDERSDSYTLRDIVPVWWEMHTVTDGVEVENDFDFSIFKDFTIQ